CGNRLLCLLTRFFTLPVALSLSAASFSFAQSVSFAPPMHFAVGTNPRYVAVGDFNSDGKPDLAVVNFGSANVSILLNTGSSSFGSVNNFGVGTDPRSLAIGDFNGDGKPDLAVANFGSEDVSILLNTGTGSFIAAADPNLLAGSMSRSVALGDLNGDGNIDLAVGDSIFLGAGTGSFGAAMSLGGANSNAVAIGDFNGDGNLDLAVTNVLGNDVSIFLCDWNGAFGL